MTVKEIRTPKSTTKKNLLPAISLTPIYPFLTPLSSPPVLHRAVSFAVLSSVPTDVVAGWMKLAQLSS